MMEENQTREGRKSGAPSGWWEEDFPPFVKKRLEEAEGVEKTPEFTESEEGDIQERVEFYEKHPEALRDLVGDDQEKLDYLLQHPDSIRGEVVQWYKRVYKGGGERSQEEPIRAEQGAESTNDEQEAEVEQLDRAEIVSKLSTTEALKWLDGKVENVRTLHEMSDEELLALLEEYEVEADNDEGEKLDRAEIVAKLSTAEALKWLDGKIENVRALHEMSDEELLALLKEYEERDAHVPLVVANIDIEKDAKEAAKDIAHRVLTEKLAEGGMAKRWIKNVIMGQMFRGGFLKKYEREAYEKILSKQRGESAELSDADWSKGDSIIETFVMAYVNQYEEMIHEEAGDKMEVYGSEVDENGNEQIYRYGYKSGEQEKIAYEDMTDEQKKAAKAMLLIKEQIVDFAKGSGSLSAKNSFKEAMQRIKEEYLGGNEESDALMIDNYLAVAMAARDRAVHEGGIKNVMEGFRFVNGEARRNVRTEAQLSRIDAITEKWANSKIGRCLPPEVVGAAAGVALWAGQRGATSLASMMTFGMGGLAVSGAMSAAREHRQVAIDQADFNRRRARGESVGEGRYNEEMESARYVSRPAKELASELEGALDKLKNESSDAALNELAAKLAEVNMLVNSSDIQNVDRISFSSADTEDIASERMALDVARARARAELFRVGDSEIAGREELLNRELERYTAELEKDEQTKDKVFNKLRRKRTIAAGARTMIAGAAFGAVTSEIRALVDPNQVGALETVLNKYAGLDTNNYANAHNTMLAGALGLKNTETVNAAAGQGKNLTQEEIVRLRNEGYTVVSRDLPTTDTQEVSVADYAQNHGTAIHRVDWAANGTAYSDGNELGVSYTPDGKGFVTSMGGTSTTWGGEVLDFNQDVSEGRMVALLSLTNDSQSTPIEVPISVSNGQIIVASGDPNISALISNRDFAYMEIAHNAGTAADGAMNIIPYATVEGNGGSGAAMLTETVTSTTTVWDVIGFEREASRLIDGALFVPLTRRKELTLGERATGGTVGRIENRTPRPVLQPEPEVRSEPARESVQEPEPGPEEPAPVIESEEPTPEPAEQNGWSEEPGSPELNGSEMGTISYRSEDPRFGNIDDDALDDIIRRSPVGAKYTKEDLRKAMSDWNASSEEVRRNALTAGRAFYSNGPARVLYESGLIDVFEPISSGDNNYGRISVTAEDMRYFDLDGQNPADVYAAVSQWNALPTWERMRYAGNYANEEVPEFVKILRRASLIQR